MSALRNAPGPLVGRRVWLTPATLSAPAVCFRQPAAEVVSVSWPYLTVVLVADGTRHQVHEDNVRTTDPGRAAERKPARRAAHALTLPEGWAEVELW